MWHKILEEKKRRDQEHRTGVQIQLPVPQPIPMDVKPTVKSDYNPMVDFSVDLTVTIL